MPSLLLADRARKYTHIYTHIHTELILMFL